MRGQEGEGIRVDIQLKRHEFELIVNLMLPATGVTVLFGHSGSGKTTLLRCIAGLDRGTGSVFFKNDRWQDQNYWCPTHKRPLAYVFQEASLFPHLTAQQNLLFAQRRASTPLQSNDAENILNLLGIKHTLNRFPNQLSGGERQRVAIARALFNNPKLLLMDEPLAALDDARKQEILPYLEQLKTSLALPIVYVTHSPAEVARLADYLVAMENGKVVSVGSLTESLSRLDFPIRLGEDAGVVLEGRVISRDEQWHLISVALEPERHTNHQTAPTLWIRDSGVKLGQTVRVRILARDVSLTTQSPSATTSIANSLPCQFDSAAQEKHPALTLARVKVGEVFILSRLTRRSLDNLAIEPGQSLWIQVKSAALVD